MSLVEGVLGGGAVANEDGKVGGDWGFFGAKSIGEKTFALETESAETEPVILGHFFNEDLFGDVDGLMLSGKVCEETPEVVGIFARHEDGVGAEAPGEAVPGGFCTALWSSRSGGFLRIGAVS